MLALQCKSDTPKNANGRFIGKWSKVTGANHISLAPLCSVWSVILGAECFVSKLCTVLRV